MRQSEALEQAIEMAEMAQATAQQPGGSQLSEWIRAAAMVSEAWIMIHDRLPMDPPGPDPAAEASSQESPYPGITIDGDERAVIETCGHHLPSLLHRGRWLHPYSLDECDDPPIVERRPSDG